MLPKIVPVLVEGMERSANNEDDMAYKEGIALGLVEVLKNAHPRLLEKYEAALTQSFYRGVCDKLLRVRNAAGKALNVGVRVFGRRCINEIVLKLTATLNIEGLKQLLFSPPKTVEQLILPNLLEELLQKKRQLHAMSLLAAHIEAQCAQMLPKHMAGLISAICDVVVADESEEQLKFGEKIVVDMVPEGQCTHLLLTSACEYLQDAVSTASAEHKVAALSLLFAFLKRSRNDYSDNVPAPGDGLVGWCVARGLQSVMGMFDYGIHNGSFFGARGRGEANGVADPHDGRAHGGGAAAAEQNGGRADPHLRRPLPQQRQVRHPGHAAADAGALRRPHEGLLHAAADHVRDGDNRPGVRRAQRGGHGHGAADALLPFLPAATRPRARARLASCST